MKKLTKILGSIFLILALVVNIYPLFASENNCGFGCQNCIGPYKTMVDKDCPNSDDDYQKCVDTYSQQTPYENYYCCADYETDCEEPY